MNVVSYECLFNEGMHSPTQGFRRAINKNTEMQTQVDQQKKCISNLEDELIQVGHKREAYIQEASQLHTELVDLKRKWTNQLCTLKFCAERESKLEEKSYNLCEELKNKVE
ncbi:hypothetical protein HAX54_047126, partial [Datura stramonium]|nr:hypothetical protein [Datura stramonium]